MNENRKEELLTRWMDDALSDEELRELEPVLAAEPELRAERVEFQKMRGELQAAIPAEVEPPYPDFFNTHLERLVQDAARGEERSGAAKLGLGRLWSWWLAPAATALVVAAFVLGMNSVREPALPVVAAVTAVYSPIANVTTKVIDHEASLGATLIVVEGLEKLTDQDLVIGDGSVEGEHGFFVTTGEIY